MSAATVPLPETGEFRAWAMKQHQRAIGLSISNDYLKVALRPFAALALPEDKFCFSDEIAQAQKDYPDDLQVEDNDLPITYGEIRYARECHNPLGAHPDMWDLHLAQVARDAEKAA